MGTDMQKAPTPLPHNSKTLTLVINPRFESLIVKVSVIVEAFCSSILMLVVSTIVCLTRFSLWKCCSQTR